MPNLEKGSPNRTPEELDRVGLFFQALAERLANENAASDIFYAAFKTFENFRSVAIKCLGLYSAVPLEITREVVVGESRPDMLFYAANEGPRFLVEVKLFDRNYHYAEYSALEIEGAKPEITLLTAHRPEPKLSGWRQVQWTSLVDELERSGDGINLALAKYFRRVAMYEELELISLARPKGILYLNRALKRVIESYQTDEVAARVNRAAREGFTEVSSGWGYELRRRAGGGRSA